VTEPGAENQSGQGAASSCEDPGAELRGERERRKYGLGKVARELGLTESALRELEQNAYDKFPAGIYVRGYLRNYCRLLGLDENRILSGYEAIAGPPVESWQPPNITSAGPKSGSGGRLYLLLGLVAVALLGTLVLWVIV
jgi:cytoskeleton protein RodZ